MPVTQRGQISRAFRSHRARATVYDVSFVPAKCTSVAWCGHQTNTLMGFGQIERNMPEPMIDSPGARPTRGLFRSGRHRRAWSVLDQIHPLCVGSMPFWATDPESVPWLQRRCCGDCRFKSSEPGQCIVWAAQGHRLVALEAEGIATSIGMSRFRVIPVWWVRAVSSWPK